MNCSLPFLTLLILSSIVPLPSILTLEHLTSSYLVLLHTITKADHCILIPLSDPSIYLCYVNLLLITFQSLLCCRKFLVPKPKPCDLTWQQDFHI